MKTSHLAPTALESLFLLCDNATQARFHELCGAASAPGCSRRELSLELRDLLLDVYGDEQPKSSQMGPLIRSFWATFGAPRLPEHSPQKVSQIHSDEELSARLPYPLGYKLGDFLREMRRFEQGVGSSNFAFQVASLNGLLLRFLGVVLLSEYVSCLGAPDVRINESLHGLLKQPSDGSWKQCIDLLLRKAKAGHAGKEQPFAGMIASSFWGERGPKEASTAQLTESLIVYRNRLLHGTHQYEEADVQTAVEQVLLLYRRLGFMCNWSYWLLTEAGAAIFPGDQISATDEVVPGAVSALAAPNTPIVYLAEKEVALSLAPLIQYATVAGDDLFFFNGWDEAQVFYISYRLARSQTARQLGGSSTDFFAFLRQIPSTGRLQEDRFDFAGVAAFHASTFTGREEVAAAVMGYLASPVRGRPYAVIRAKGGMGKTAFMAMLYQRFVDGEIWPKRVWPLWHFCSASGGRHHPALFLRSMLAQLDEFLGTPEKEYPTSIDLLRQLLQRRLRYLRNNPPTGPDGPVTIVWMVDALDEALRSTRGSLSIPAILPPASSLPQSMAVLVTYRVDDDGQNQQVEQLLPASELEQYSVPGASPLGGLNRDDVSHLLAHVCQKRGVTADVEAAIWQTSSVRPSTNRGIQSDSLAASQTLADPFVLRFLTDGIKDGTIDSLRAETVPASLHALFDQLWNRLPTDNHFFLHRLLGMLALMPSSGTDALFAAIFSVIDQESAREDLVPDDIAERRLAINKLLVFTGDRYRIFHQRFQQYVVERFRPKEQARHIHLPLYAYCASSYGSGSLYDLKHRLFHLQALASHDGLSVDERQKYETLLWSLLWDDDYFDDKFAHLNRIDALVSDFLQAFEVFRPQPAATSTEVEERDVWRAVARTFHLCQRTHHVVSHAVERSQERLAAHARRGEVDQVIRIAHWEGASYRRLFRVLLGAVWMHESGEDATRLLSLLESLGTPSLREGEVVFAEALLHKAAAPKPVMELVRSWRQST